MLDDADIAHAVFEQLVVPDFHTFGGLRLESSASSSLVLKFGGPGDPFDPGLNCVTNDAQHITNLDGSVTCLQASGVTYAPASGIIASGRQLDIDDRIGGMLHIIGQPGFPVVLTSLHDDSIGAGLTSEGDIQRDTNNNGSATLPKAGGLAKRAAGTVQP